ncbi:adenosine kinase-like [Physella acuta]|uniref:adenosine kinase-like n=1 Tax=Physella acuta TaxID=109671 RepID=UPI0027DE546D|nr:adenosine kinase-like [Physella acuta]XP_059163838.1 adenosine kinase-like [Physella acuta]XP_059163839.1 adenosine kinase-like [Physella acuta]
MDAKVKDILNDALDKFPNDYHINCGGPALNIARSAQAMVHTPRSLIFLGEKALDDMSIQLVHVFKESHLGFQLEENHKSKTNVMVILYCKDKWCELYFVDANSSFSTSFVDRPSISKLLSRSNILILSDLSILMTPKAAQKFSYYCSASFKVLAVNLSNVDILTRAKLNVCDILNCADILFLNKRSAKALMQIFNISCVSTLRQTSHIAAWIKSLSKKQCTVVVFNGNVVYVTDSNVTSKHKTPFKKKHPIVDHYGVHCAFVGGFIAGIGQGCPLDICIDSGFYCADIVTGQFGLTFPSNMGDLLSLWKLHMEQYLAKKASLNNGEISTPFKKLST